MDRFDDDRLADVHEAEQRAVRGLEARAQDLRGIVRVPADFDRRLAARVAQVKRGDEADIAGIYALRRDPGDRLTPDARFGPRDQAGNGAVERLLDRGLAGCPDRRQSHAVGGEQPGIGMDQDLRHAELIGHQAGVLPWPPRRSN